MVGHQADVPALPVPVAARVKRVPARAEMKRPPKPQPVLHTDKLMWIWQSEAYHWAIACRNWDSVAPDDVKVGKSNLVQAIEVRACCCKFIVCAAVSC